MFFNKSILRSQLWCLYAGLYAGRRVGSEATGALRSSKWLYAAYTPGSFPGAEQKSIWKKQFLVPLRQPIRRGQSGILMSPGDAGVPPHPRRLDAGSWVGWELANADINCLYAGLYAVYIYSIPGSFLHPIRRHIRRIYIYIYMVSGAMAKPNTEA